MQQQPGKSGLFRPKPKYAHQGGSNPPVIIIHGNHLEGIADSYKRYLEKNAKDANARVDLGICYFENGDTEEAQKQMLVALKYDPKHLQAHFNLGIVNLKARRMQEANDWFKKTIALAPPNSEIGQQARQFLEQHSSPLIQNK